MTTEEKHILQNSRRQFFQQNLRYLKTKQGAFESSMHHLDHPLFNGGRVLEPTDNHRGEMKLLSEIDREADYVYLVRATILKLTGIERKICRAILRYDSLEKARRHVKLSRKAFREKIKNLKPHFTQCLRAYNAC